MTLSISICAYMANSDDLISAAVRNYDDVVTVRKSCVAVLICEIIIHFAIVAIYYRICSESTKILIKIRAVCRVIILIRNCTKRFIKASACKIYIGSTGIIPTVSIRGGITLVPVSCVCTFIEIRRISLILNTTDIISV